MKIRFLTFLLMSFVTELALFHLPEGNNSKSHVAAFPSKPSLMTATRRLLAEPKYRPIIPPSNVMVNPLIRPKQDGDFCKHSIEQLDGMILEVA
jgi:hypothetical protein